MQNSRHEQRLMLWGNRLRNGFTLVELLVTLGIIGVVLAILLPAVQSAREAMRRTSCENRIRQSALAIQNFESTHRLLPGNGGPTEENRLISVSGESVRPYTHEFATGIRRFWGVGTAKSPIDEQPGPWTWGILPQFEQAHLHVDHVFVDRVSTYLCPSRPRPTPQPPQADYFGEYEAGGHAMAKTDFAANHLVILDRGSVVRLKDVRDGLSQTILLGEKVIDPFVQDGTSWYWDEPIYIGGSKGTARAGELILTDAVDVRFRDNWGSSHSALAYFAFVDGHVRSLTNQTDADVLNALLTPDDGDQLPSF